MAISEKKKVSNAKYNKKCDNINLRPLMEDGARVRQAAADAGQSLQGYIMQAVNERIERDKR
jgi:predicted HicB family RNase H-like nuclease